MRTNPWDADSIRRFWDWQAADPASLENYFSLQVGAGIVEVLATEIHSGSILDLGCGPGFLAQRLLDAGYEVTGVDQSPDSVAAAQERCGSSNRWQGATLDAETFGDGSFDAVTCIETVEHLDDQALDGVLSEVRRLLRPGGVAMFTTPNDEDLSAAMTYCPFCDTAFHRVQHVRSWTASTLGDRLRESGFDLRRVAATNLALWQPISQSGWLPLRGRASVTRHRLLRRQRWGDGPHLVALAAVG